MTPPIITTSMLVMFYRHCTDCLRELNCFTGSLIWNFFQCSLLLLFMIWSIQVCWNASRARLRNFQEQIINFISTQNLNLLCCITTDQSSRITTYRPLSAWCALQNGTLCKILTIVSIETSGQMLSVSLFVGFIQERHFSYGPEHRHGKSFRKGRGYQGDN